MIIPSRHGRIMAALLGASLPPPVPNEQLARRMHEGGAVAARRLKAETGGAPYNYIGTCGPREQARRVRQQMKRVLRLVKRDPLNAAALARLQAACAGQPAEFGGLESMAISALHDADKVHAPWWLAVDEMLRLAEEDEKAERSA
jgi:hypothetical protein